MNLGHTHLKENIHNSQKHIYTQTNEYYKIPTRPHAGLGFIQRRTQA